MLKTLRRAEWTQSVHAFGESVHLATKRGSGEEDLRSFLLDNGLGNVEMQRISAGIEDCFMDFSGRREDAS
jgi:hypothetical protein